MIDLESEWLTAHAQAYRWPCVEVCIGPWRTCKLSCFLCKSHKHQGRLWSPECGHILLPARTEKHTLSHWAESKLLWPCRQKQRNTSWNFCLHVQGLKLKRRTTKKSVYHYNKSHYILTLFNLCFFKQLEPNVSVGSNPGYSENKVRKNTCNDKWYCVPTEMYLKVFKSTWLILYFMHYKSSATNSVDLGEVLHLY